MCQMFCDRVNQELLTNLLENPNLHGQKHLTYEICQRKFGRAKARHYTNWLY